VPYKDPARQAAASRAWRQKNRELNNARERERRRTNEATRASRRRAVRRNAGVLDATGENRVGRCALCPYAGLLVCDHDHTTGLTRGWLCRKCNTGLGKLGDTVESVGRALAYLIDARRDHAARVESPAHAYESLPPA
jgi:hypothetical protein